MAYILNLAGAEAEMQSASYPCDSIVEIEADRSDDHRSVDMFSVPDDPDDGVVRVMKLPMVDNDNHEKGDVLEVESSWQVWLE